MNRPDRTRLEKGMDYEINDIYTEMNRVMTEYEEYIDYLEGILDDKSINY